MSLQQKLDDVVDEARSLTNTVEDFIPAFEQKVEDTLNLFNNSGARLYVHAISGNDANTGTIHEPLKTLERALEIAHFRGTTAIFVGSDITLTTARAPLSGDGVHISGMDFNTGALVTRKLNFSVPSANVPTEMASFTTSANEFVRFTNIDIQMPVLPAGIAGDACVIASNGGIFNLHNCNVVGPNGIPNSFLFAATFAPIDVYVLSTTFHGNTVNRGCRFKFVAAGADPNSSFLFNTNITSN